MDEKPLILKIQFNSESREYGATSRVDPADLYPTTEWNGAPIPVPLEARIAHIVSEYFAPMIAQVLFDRDRDLASTSTRTGE